MKKVENSIPPNIVIPTVNLLAAPGPVPIISGRTPNTVDRLVIKIGLNLIVAASIMLACAYQNIVGRTFLVTIGSKVPIPVHYIHC